MLQKIIDGRTDLVFDYLQKGNDASATDEHGRPLILWCAYYGDVSAVKYLLTKGASLEGLGPNLDLNGAAFHGHWQLVQYLLERGADPKYALPDTGETPLHACIVPNRPAMNLIIKLLLHHGADPNATTLPHKPSGAFMRDAYTKEETPLHRAAAFGNTETIQLLLDAGAEVNQQDMNGDSPLSYASWHQRPAAILKLLCFGDYKIHPLHVQHMQSDHGAGWGGGMSILRMGKVHF